jgi:hypothetical protein
MKLHVVFNKEGEILGAAQLSSGTAQPNSGPRIRARPIADEQAGQRASDVYVPAEFQHYDLAAICQRLKVDVAGKFPNLKAKN